MLIRVLQDRVPLAITAYVLTMSILFSQTMSKLDALELTLFVFVTLSFPHSFVFWGFENRALESMASLADHRNTWNIWFYLWFAHCMASVMIVIFWAAIAFTTMLS